MNTFKTLMLMVLLTVMLVMMGGVIGGQSGMTIALVIAFAVNFGSYWFSDKIVLHMYGAQQVTEAEAPELYSIVRRLTARAQLPMPKVYIMDEDQPNAFATGRNPNHSAVAVTGGIMNILTREELEGVLAHELAHVKHRDILISTIAASIAGAITYLTHFAFFFGGGRDDDEGMNPVAMIIMMIVAPIAAMIVQMAISRSREFAADSGGAEICGQPRFLANALRKLDITSRQIPMEDANPATAHMFIVSPLFGGGLSKLFSTHPPMEERIARLEAMSTGGVR
jgi:heat shock protein HtpX